MGIKETPVNFRVYYTNMKNSYTQDKEKLIEDINNLYVIRDELYYNIKNNIDVYNLAFGIDLNKYEEFINNEYIKGSFYKIAKGLFINKKENYKIVSDLYDLYKLAKTQKEIKDTKDNIELCDKMLSLSLSEYNNILKTFYTEVHKKLIQGYGYVFEGHLGWICINRCKLVNVKPHIDYAATKKNKLKLLAEGKKLYNKEEAEWCKKNDIKYDGVDPRIYLHDEYCYQVPLLGCKLPNAFDYKLELADYRGLKARGKTNEELLKETNNDKDTICELPVDLKTKLTLCLKADKMLYLNFIRNENQKPITFTTINRKNR